MTDLDQFRTALDLAYRQHASMIRTALGPDHRVVTIIVAAGEYPPSVLETLRLLHDKNQATLAEHCRPAPPEMRVSDDPGSVRQPGDCSPDVASLLWGLSTPGLNSPDRTPGASPGTSDAQKDGK